jgi:hypothetical protein
VSTEKWVGDGVSRRTKKRRTLALSHPPLAIRRQAPGAVVHVWRLTCDFSVICSVGFELAKVADPVEHQIGCEGHLPGAGDALDDRPEQEARVAR